MNEPLPFRPIRTFTSEAALDRLAQEARDHAGLDDPDTYPASSGRQRILDDTVAIVPFVESTQSEQNVVDL